MKWTKFKRTSCHECIALCYRREKRNIPFIISACIREVERRGMYEIGVYRVSGSASDLAKLKKSFETSKCGRCDWFFEIFILFFCSFVHSFADNYEAEQLLKEVDIHSVTGILKSYLRELPEALFTDLLYPKLFDIYNKYSNFNETGRIDDLQRAFAELPEANRESINFILEHLIRYDSIARYAFSNRLRLNDFFNFAEFINKKPKIKCRYTIWLWCSVRLYYDRDQTLANTKMV